MIKRIGFVVGLGSLPAILAASLAHSSLIMHLDFENGFADSSGMGNDAVVDSRSRGSVSTVAGGVFGNALSIADGLGWLTVLDSPSLSPTEELTLSAWVKPTGQVGSNSGVFFKGKLIGQQPDWQIAIGDVGTGAVGAIASINGTGFASSEASVVDSDFLSPIPLSTWTHLAMTYDQSALRLYVNSTLVETAQHTGPLDTSGSPLYIGNRFKVTGDVGGFQGLMDELRVYDNALSAAEILSLASVPPVAAAVPEPGSFGLAAAGFFALAACRRRGRGRGVRSRSGDRSRVSPAGRNRRCWPQSRG